LWFNLIDETVGDISVSIVEQLAYDEFIQVLSVFQSQFGTIHVGSLQRLIGLQPKTQCHHLNYD